MAISLFLMYEGVFSMKGAEIVIETLIEQGTEVIYGYPGGQVVDIYEALYSRGDRIKHILTAHEQGAAHAADGYARATGKVGVVLATSGPGATNLVTGIANAYLDSVPMVAITGNVPTDMMGKDGFQEVDIAGITMPIVKHNYIVHDIAKLADIIREAFQIAKSGRPGPVLVDVPKNIQLMDYPYEKKEVVEPYKFAEANAEYIEDAIKIINSAKKPYIYIGGGVISAGVSDLVEELAEIIDAPIGSSMMGLSAISYDNRRFLGMTGMHGRYAATAVKSRADVIIALGTRFSDRAVSNSEHLKDTKIIHVDIDAAEIDKNIKSYIGIIGDLKSILESFNSKVKSVKHPKWMAEVEDVKNYARENTPEQKGKLTPQEIIECVNKFTADDTPIVTDVGQHQMWVAQMYNFKKPRTFISSGGLGTMGFGLGAAIGSVMSTGKRAVLFTGDGSLGMNLTELATAVTNELPIVIVLMNNGVLGMVRQMQTLFKDKHYSHTTLNRKSDFVKIAEGFGAKGYRAEDVKELENALEDAFASDGVCLIDCAIDLDELVLPMIPSNGKFKDVILK